MSTEPQQIYPTNCPKIFGLRGNLQHLIIWKQWRFLLALLPKKLRPVHSNGENLVQEYERKFEQLSEDQKLSKPCSGAGLKLVVKGQYFYTLDTEEGQQMQHLCREYTMPRNEKGIHVRGWLRENTRIGSVLNTKVCNHDDRYSIEVQIPSLFQDNTASWVRIVNGVDKYVTESMLTKKEVDIASGKPIAKARPRQTPTVTLTSVSIPVLERKRIDIETQRSHDQKCSEVSKVITRLQRHDQSVPRGSDGAIHYSDIIEECRKQKFDDTSQWSLEDWISTLGKGGGAKKRFQCCLNPNSSNQFLYLRAIQGHSGDNAVDTELQDNMLLPKGSTEYNYHVGNASELNSIIRKWIDCRKKKHQKRKTSDILHYNASDG